MYKIAKGMRVGSMEHWTRVQEEQDLHPGDLDAVDAIFDNIPANEVRAVDTSPYQRPLGPGARTSLAPNLAHCVDEWPHVAPGYAARSNQPPPPVPAASVAAPPKARPVRTSTAKNVVPKQPVGPPPGVTQTSSPSVRRPKPKSTPSGPREAAAGAVPRTTPDPCRTPLPASSEVSFTTDPVGTDVEIDDEHLAKELQIEERRLALEARKLELAKRQSRRSGGPLGMFVESVSGSSG